MIEHFIYWKYCAIVSGMITSREAAREIVALLPTIAVNLRVAALFDLGAAELTPNQILALEMIRTAPGGRMKAGGIAVRLGISMPAATALVDRLVSAGVAARSQGDDRRVVWIAATPAGERLVAELTEGLERRLETAIESGYDAPTLEALVEGMRRVASLADRLASSVPAPVPGEEGAHGALGPASVHASSGLETSGDLVHDHE